MTVGDGDGVGGGAGVADPGGDGGADARGVVGAGLLGRGFADGAGDSGAPVVDVGAGRGDADAGAGDGAGVGDGLGVEVGVGVAHTGNTELRDSSSIWPMASSNEPDGSPAITWARSEGRISPTARSVQSRGSPDWSALMRESSLRLFRHPRRYGSCKDTPRKEP